MRQWLSKHIIQQDNIFMGGYRNESMEFIERKAIL